MNRNSRRFFLACLLSTSSLSALALPAVAQAQENGQPAARATGGPLENITVTATRREEGVQNVPVTMTAVTGDTILESGISTVRDLTYVTPGYTGGRNFGVQQPVIRGVGSSGTSPADEANVAIYVDGVYQGSSYGTFTDLVEVERVEILRGPQGTVFGRNATGGLINVITPEPSYDFFGYVRGRAGFMDNDNSSKQDTDVRGYITGGITDNVAVDLAALYRNKGDYVENLLGGDDFGGIEVVNVRSKILFEPADGIELVLTAEKFSQNGKANAPAPVEGRTAGAVFPGVVIPDEPWEAALDILPKLDLDRTAFALRTKFEFNGFNLESTHGYSDTDTRQNSDSDASNIFIGLLDIGTTAPDGRALYALTESMSHEIRLLSNDGGRLNWVAGLYYFELETETSAHIEVLSPFGLVVVDSLGKTNTTSYAAFAEGTLEVTDRFFVTLGGRYTDEDKESDPFSTRTIGAGPTVVTSDAPVNGSFDSIDYRVALRYQITDTTNVYGSFGTGFKSGVFSGGAADELIKPEEIEAWEVGVKSDPLPWLRTNLAAYYYEYTDLQVNARDPADTAYILQNAANAEIMGAELEVTAAATDNLTIRGSVAYNDATYDQFAAAQVFPEGPGGTNTVATADVSGNRLIRAPEWTANIGASWDREFDQGRLGVAGNIFYSSRVYHDILNLESRSQDPYFMTSGEIFWTTLDDTWKFTLWGRNLFNEDVLQQMRNSNLSSDGLYEPPRSIGVGVTANF